MKKYCFGVDVGGTTIKIGFLDTDGTMLDKWEIKTNTENFGEIILSDICESLENKIMKKSVLMIYRVLELDFLVLYLLMVQYFSVST